jgi:O-antigen/teichoic acid export membrane protein
MKTPPPQDFTRIPATKTLAGFTIWNLAGSGLPLVFGLIAFPIMLNESIGFGKERLEIIGLVWMLVGFSSIFDMGLGRALTRAVSEKLSLRRNHELGDVFWTAMILSCGVGLVVGLLSAWLVPLAAARDLPPPLKGQATASFVLIGLSMPLIVWNVGLQGVLQSCRQFKRLNVIRALFGSYTFLSPLAVLPFSKSVLAVVAVLIAGRLIEMLTYFAGCLASLPELRRGIRFCPREFGPLARFGGWMTASNVSVNLMNHINRFIIRAFEKIGEGTYYFIPEELAVRLLIVPRAWIDVLFPAMVTGFATADHQQTGLFSKGVKYLLLMTAPLAAGLVAVSYPFFEIWLPNGGEFARKSALVMALLTAGIFLHGIARFVWYFLQAAGRPDRPARLHAAELPLTLAVSAWLVHRFGIEGAALAWALRSLADLVFLSWMSARYLDRPGALWRPIGAFLTAATALQALCAWPTGLAARLGVAGLGLAILFAFAWRFLLNDSERDDLRTLRRGAFAALRGRS